MTKVDAKNKIVGMIILSVFSVLFGVFGIIMLPEKEKRISIKKEQAQEIVYPYRNYINFNFGESRIPTEIGVLSNEKKDGYKYINGRIIEINKIFKGNSYEEADKIYSNLYKKFDDFNCIRTEKGGNYGTATFHNGEVIIKFFIEGNNVVLKEYPSEILLEIIKKLPNN